MSKWIEFHQCQVPPGYKTKSWDVCAKAGGHLGNVRWYAPWRQYAFYPKAETLYERQCLRDLADFCERETRAQFQASRAAKAQKKAAALTL
jgi:hypothetical protein